MAEGIVLERTYKAASDLSAKQYYMVKLTADLTVDVAADGDKAIGVLQNKPTSGQAAVVRVYGWSYVVVSSEGLSVADLVASDPSGTATTATSGEHVIGVAERAPSGTGALATIILVPGKA